MGKNKDVKIDDVKVQTVKNKDIELTMALTGFSRDKVLKMVESKGLTVSTGGGGKSFKWVPTTSIAPKISGFYKVTSGKIDGFAPVTFDGGTFTAYWKDRLKNKKGYIPRNLKAKAGVKAKAGKKAGK